MQLKPRDGDFNYAFAGLRDIRENPMQTLTLTLKKREGRHYPYIGNQPIRYAMFKITKIPVAYHKRIMEFVTEHNDDNLFYVWKGNLIPELNEILILINLSIAHGEQLAALIPKQMKARTFLADMHKHTTFLDARISALMELLCTMDEKRGGIWVEPPFRFEPYITLWPTALPRLYGKTLVPVGDSLVRGHVKIGNGLGYHLWYVKELATTIMQNIGQVEKVKIA